MQTAFTPVCGTIFLLPEQVADLASSNSFVGAGSGAGAGAAASSFSASAGSSADHQEDTECQDRKVNALLDEGAVIPVNRLGSRLHGSLRRCPRHDVADGMHGTRSHVPELRNVEPQAARNRYCRSAPDRRHQDVVHQRRHDRQRAADELHRRPCPSRSP